MSRLSRIGVKFLLALLSTAGSLVLAEVVSRRFFPVEMAHFVDCQEEPTSILVDDAELAFRMKADFCGKLVGSEFRNSVRTNSSGFRAPMDFRRDKDGAFRILGLGDSFAFGWGVEQDQAYLSLLERTLRERTGTRVEVLNLGVWGYGTLQEIKVFEQFKEYRPDLVILEFYARDAFVEEWGNDLVDNYHFYQWYRSKGSRRQRRTATDRQAEVVSAMKTFIAIHCNLCRIAALELGPYVKRNFHPAGNEALRNAAWEITGEALKRLDGELQSMNIRCVLLWVAPPGTIKARDFSVPNRLNAMGLQAIEVVSSLDAFSGDLQKYYYALDNHWRPAGHEVVAHLLLQHILSRHLVSRRSSGGSISVKGRPGRSDWSASDTPDLGGQPAVRSAAAGGAALDGHRVF